MIRFHGYKGIVTVDPSLDKEGKVHMRLRSSMRKFESLEDDPNLESYTAPEIAEIYDRPIRCYLNRLVSFELFV